MVKFFDKAKVDFIVKENEGVVVAKFSEPKEVAHNLYFLMDTNLYTNFSDYDKLLKRVSSVRGIAKCAPEDKFDIKIGKKIALNKLKMKTAISFLGVVSNSRNKLHEILEKYNSLIFDGIFLANKLDERLNAIYNTVETKN